MRLLFIQGGIKRIARLTIYSVNVQIHIRNYIYHKYDTYLETYFGDHSWFAN